MKNIQHKIFKWLGILIIFTATGAYFMFDTNMKQNSRAFGVNVLVAKANIEDGTVIGDTNQAKNLFTVRRVTQAEVVPTAIKVNVSDGNNSGIMANIKNLFIPADGTQISDATLNALVGQKITTNIYKNEQVLKVNLDNDSSKTEDSERYYDIPVTYTSAVGGEIKKGDFVDVWVHYDLKNSGNGGADSSANVIGPLQVVKVKDANNMEITNNSKDVPNIVVFKMNEKDISAINDASNKGTLFLTKYGKNPSSKAKIEKVQNGSSN